MRTNARSIDKTFTENVRERVKVPSLFILIKKTHAQKSKSKRERENKKISKVNISVSTQYTTERKICLLFFSF